MSFTINNTQEIPLQGQAFDQGGVSLNIAPYSPVWSSSNPALIQVGVAPDGFQVAAAVHGQTGTATITFSMTRTDGTPVNATQVATVTAAPVPVPATAGINIIGGARPRTLS